MDAEHLADSIAALGVEAGLAQYQRQQGAFGSGIVQQGQRDGSYITDQLKPREQRRNKDCELGGRRPDARPQRPQRPGEAAFSTKSRRLD